MRLFLFERSGGPLGRGKRRVGEVTVAREDSSFFFSAAIGTEAFLAGSLLGWGMAGQMV